MRYFLFIVFSTVLISPGHGDDVPSLLNQELTNYRFSTVPVNDQVLVTQLNVSQQFILSSRRRDFNNLLYRHLGILEARGDKRDIAIIQEVIDQKLLPNDQIKAWQSMGIVFGDILAKEFGMAWVSYEDELGISKALRWKETDNYVFPITFFSKRVQFGESIDANVLYNNISNEINQFKEDSARVAGQRHNR